MMGEPRPRRIALLWSSKPKCDNSENIECGGNPRRDLHVAKTTTAWQRINGLIASNDGKYDEADRGDEKAGARNSTDKKPEGEEQFCFDQGEHNHPVANQSGNDRFVNVRPTPFPGVERG